MKKTAQAPKIIILCVALFMIIGIIATAGSQTQTGNQPQQDEATVVKRGQATDKEKEYSKEYRKIYSDRAGKKITEIKQKGNIGVSIGVGSYPRSKDEGVISINQFLEKLSCQTDTIVEGVIRNKKSHLSDDETFVFTEYNFDVKKVLKNNAKLTIGTNQTISITRPGGLIKVDNQLIKFEDLNYEPLKINREYLLFLKFVPLAKGYVTASPEGDFLLDNNMFKSLSKRGLINEINKDVESEILFNRIQSAVSANCNQ